MARLVFAIQSLPENTQIGSFIHGDGSVRCIQCKQIVAAVRHAAAAETLVAAAAETLVAAVRQSHGNGGIVFSTVGSGTNPIAQRGSGQSK